MTRPLKPFIRRLPRLSSRPAGIVCALSLIVFCIPAWPHEGGGHEVRDADRHSADSGSRDRGGGRDARSALSDSGSRGGSAQSDGGASGSSGSSGSGSSGSDSSGGSSNSGSSGSGSSGSGGDSSGPGSGDDDKNRVDTTKDDSNRGGERIAIEHGSDGRDRLPREVLMIGGADALAAVRAAGFNVQSEKRLAALGESVARIALPPGQSVEQAVLKLQALVPAASVAPNHVYRPSQSGTSPARLIAPAPAVPLAASQNSGRARRLGLIDTGVDLTPPLLALTVVRTQAFAGGAYIARAHGTLVAEIASAGGARLEVADVFGVDDDHRLAAPADAIAGAIAWLISEQVPVINISIEGPDNAVMAHLIRRATAAGIAVVAAAGNDGPAAPPAYPAAYAGVIAVTAIDDRDRVYRRANRGDYITFAARGVNVVSASGSFAGQPVSGTSFAAPAVAAIIARRLSGESPGDVAAVVDELQHEARDLGAAGRDPVYGWGAIGPGSAGPQAESASAQR